MYYVLFILSICTFSASRKPNIVLFLTDDQDLMLGGLTPVTKTLESIANHGVTFQNAFVNAPICCPSRSSLLTGMLPHNTGVTNNSVSGNCAGPRWIRNSEPYALAPLLSDAGYINFYSGKYLNQYDGHHVPIGWHWWYGLIGNSKYYKYILSVNGTQVHYANTYLTDLMKTQALDFLDQSRLKHEPFFMVLATPAPHAPFTPADRHRGKFTGEKALKTPSFNYTPYNKHWLLQMPPRNIPTDAVRLDEIQQHRFESLLAVDELVESVIKKLSNINQLDDTYILYTSDNGYHIGQFGQPWDKRQPYDTDIRVPLLMRGPGVKVKSVYEPAVQSIDLAPTLLEIAGVPTPYYMDGYSFLQHLINGSEQNWHRNILIEYHGEHNKNEQCPWRDNDLAECSEESWCKCQDSKNNTYNCVRQLSRQTDFLFCKFLDDESFIEAYDMSTDKYQLRNIFNEMKRKDVKLYSRLIDDLLACKGKLCRNL